MPAIDALLRVMTLRDADSIALVAGQPPALRRRGEREVMSMPALEPSLVAVFAEEVLADQHARLADAGRLEVSYRAADGPSYLVAVELASGELRLIARPAGRPPAAPTPPAPPALASAASASAAAAEVPAAGQAAPAPASSHGPSPPRLVPHAAVTPTPRVLALLAAAAARGAADLVLTQGRPARMRVEGALVSAADDDDGEPIELADLHALVGSDRSAARLADAGHLDFAFEAAGTRVRANVFLHHDGLAAVLRLIRAGVPSLAELGLPAELAGAVEARDGLVLVCGQTGSGKSTTAIALLDHLVRTRAAHVVTLEDPIERRLPSRLASVHQREIGTHTPDFATGLRAALREAPDVIFVGELRDPETIATALTAADTGHLVLGTLHCAGVVGAIDRIVDAFPEHQQRQARGQLAAVLRAVLTQQLVARRTGGRIAAVEYVPINAAVAHLIRKGEGHHIANHVQTGRDAGMVSFERSLARLVRSGAITAAVARTRALDLEVFEAALRAG